MKKHGTEQELPPRISLRAAARALHVSHPTLKHYLTTGVIPAKHPDLPARYEAFKKQKEDRPMLTKTYLPPEALKHWGFTKDPFSHEIADVEDILELKESARAERKLMAAVDRGGWVCITGPVGCGKTTLLKRDEERLAQRKDVVMVKPRMLEKQYLGASHVCDAIINDLGDGHQPGRGTLEAKARHVGRLLEEAYRDGKKVVLLIDEAHLLRPEALLALKRIYEFEIGFKKLLSIILIGQQPLARLLRTNYAMSEVAQRVDLFEIPPLNGSLHHYLRHKLTRAGQTEERELFTVGALRAIAERADTPLSINNLAAAALISAWQLRAPQVSEEMVEKL